MTVSRVVYGADSPVCSFCHGERSEGSRRLLFAGPDGVFICDGCVDFFAVAL